jgi:hypothetical protein
VLSLLATLQIPLLGGFGLILVTISYSNICGRSEKTRAGVRKGVTSIPQSAMEREKRAASGDVS